LVFSASASWYARFQRAISSSFSSTRDTEGDRVLIQGGGLELLPSRLEGGMVMANWRDLQQPPCLSILWP
jgi:hypothetical protein